MIVVVRLCRAVGAASALGYGELEAQSARGQVAGRYRAAVQQHRVLHDGEPQSCAAHLAAAPLVYAVEPLEEARQMLGRHSYAVVAERELPCVAAIGGADCYRGAVAGVCYGVVGEVAEYAVQ